jgi:type IV pilus assembly protein PilW
MPMKSRQTGLSLVEIMVAVVIGMIGILIITQAYISSDNFNRATIGEGGAQTNGLIALYSIERDVRTSGYGIADSTALGCGEIYWYYNPNYSKNITSGSPLSRIRLAPIYITTNGAAPDDLSVMYATDSERMVPTTVKTFTAASSLVELDSKTGFAVNDLILLAKSSGGCTLAKVTSVEADPSKKLQLNPGTPHNPTAWGSFPTSYAIGDLVFNLGATPVVRTYSISSGKLVVSDALQQAAGAAAVQLMDGIVDLRAQYGKDNGTDNGTVSSSTYAPSDGQVDQFSNSAPANSAEWQQVISMRLGVLARIGTYEKPDPATGFCMTTTAQPTWSGGTFTAVSVASSSADRCYRYRVFETIIPLRNMIWRGS